MTRWISLALVLLLSACSSWLPKCVVCDQTIMGTFGYATVDGQRFVFHRQHAPKFCKFCGGVLAAKLPWGKAEHTPEGFDVCHKCKSEGVRDVATAQALVKQVRADLVRLGVTIPWGPIPVMLRKPDDPGAMAHCSALRYANGAVNSLSIRFMPGMPRTVFKGTAAHELTHAWAYTHRSPARQDMALSEGAPQVVEYLYLEKDQSPQARHQLALMMTSNHPVYGVGMRRLKKYQEEHKLAGLLAVLKTGAKIPKGY